jgi:hypothetical protein
MRSTNRSNLFFVVAVLEGSLACTGGVAPPSDSPDIANVQPPSREGDDGPIVPAKNHNASLRVDGSTLLVEAQRMLGAVRSTRYTHTTYVDETRGVFDFDCSGFVDYALANVAPAAYADLRAQTRQRPLAESYVEYFRAAQAHPSWHRIDSVDDLVSGDVIAWLEPADSQSTNTGHVLIVREPVLHTDDAARSIRIIDSTESPHGPDDTRAATGETGLGSGTIVLVVDSTGKPVGFRWSTGPDSRTRYTEVGLGRLE